MQSTPLNARHQTLGAHMAPFADWNMPIQYRGIVAEHLHTRTVASVFDTCHMGEFQISGPTATADLERLLTLRVETLALYQCRYGYLLNENGGILDDLTCYRTGPDTFYLVVNAGTRAADADWIQQHLATETRFADLSAETAKLDVQGPQSRALLSAALGQPVPDLKYFRACHWEVDGLNLFLSRTGYTGEWGYELYLPAAAAPDLWDRLMSNAQLQPAGLGARDTLRLEVGYPLYGHELGPERTPAPASQTAFLALDKDFIGRAATVHDLEHGREKLVGLQLQTKRAARAGDPVFAGERAIGCITSGCYAPSLGVAIAFAYIEKEVAQPGQTVIARSRNTDLSAQVVDLPFYRDGTARALQPA
jgi:aminomethyltransferase